MAPEQYRERLGGVVGNFHALEFVLRAFLQAPSTARPIGIPHGTDIYSFPVGADLPENELTSYDSLGILIEKFNTDMASRGLSGIDLTLVQIRDVVAHGRVNHPTLFQLRNLASLFFQHAAQDFIGVLPQRGRR